MDELAKIVETLMAKGFDLRAIAACVGTSKLALKYLLAGKPVDLEYRVKARLQFLYYQSRNKENEYNFATRDR